MNSRTGDSKARLCLYNAESAIRTPAKRKAPAANPRGLLNVVALYVYFSEADWTAGR